MLEVIVEGECGAAAYDCVVEYLLEHVVGQLRELFEEVLPDTAEGCGCLVGFFTCGRDV
ncbi:hypothetical protein ACIO93_43385 [Streptomyces sp. NPDC087903]|uniref:hypothetical protein n=1 Tax=Streptomyces sp. NPDC087903 TaxID=3365819 RepID=UPI00381E6020